MVMLLQVAVCDLSSKSALEHCTVGGRCLPFLAQHVHKLEQHASSIAQQLLEEECKLVAGHVDNSMHRHKAVTDSMLASSHSALLQVSRNLLNATNVC